MKPERKLARASCPSDRLAINSPMSPSGCTNPPVPLGTTSPCRSLAQTLVSHGPARLTTVREGSWRVPWPQFAGVSPRSSVTTRQVS